MLSALPLVFSDSDTFISIRGLLLATGQYDEARSLIVRYGAGQRTASHTQTQPFPSAFSPNSTLALVFHAQSFGTA